MKMFVSLFLSLLVILCFSSEYEFVKKGDAAFNNGKFSEAVKYYNSAIEINPITRYLFKRAEVRFLMKQLTNAVIDLRQIIGEEPNHLSSRRLLGKIYFQSGKFEDAEEQFNHILVLKPDDKTIKDYIPKINTAKQRLSSIQTDEDRMRVLPYIIKEFSPESRDFRLELADTAIRTKYFNIAKPEMMWLLKRDPGDGFVHHLYSCKFLYEAMGDIEEGKKGLKKCLNLDPENSKCLKCFKRIKKLNRYADEIKEMKDNGRNWKAVRLYEDFLDLASPEQYNYDEYAIEYCKTFRAVEDKEELALNSCKERCPSHPECELVRAELLISLQRFEEARQAMNKVREDSGDQYQQQLSRITEQLKNEERKANRIDYYKLLNVSKKATEHEIRKAYRKKALIYHPDRAKSEEQREEFSTTMIQLNQAIEILMDEEKRKRYDVGDDVNDIFGGRKTGHGPFTGTRFNFNFGQGGFFRNF